MPNPEPKQVVVLGGGYIGSRVARALDKSGKVRVTLVDRREVSIHKIAGLRGAVDAKWQKSTTIPRTHLLKKGKVVVGEATSVDASKVTLDSGKELNYDYLVIATGSHNTSPGEPPVSAKSAEQIYQHQSAIGAAVRKAKSIAIIGGGVVGVEFAGEIRDLYKDKKITIVHSGKQVLGHREGHGRLIMPAGFYSKLNKQLKSRKIETVCEVKAELPAELKDGAIMLEGERTLSLSNGGKVECDLVVLCVGTTPNTQALPSEWLNEGGLVKVNESLQSVVAPNVFAVGDVCDVVEEKSFVFGNVHVSVVVKNVISAVSSSPLKAKHKAHAANKPIMFVTLGKSHGAGALPVFSIGKFAVSLAKGKGLFTGMMFKDVGERAPSRS